MTCHWPSGPRHHRGGLREDFCPEELLMQRAKDEVGAKRDMTCQRLYWPRPTTRSPSLVPGLLGCRIYMVPSIPPLPTSFRAGFLHSFSKETWSFLQGGHSLPDRHGMPLA